MERTTETGRKKSGKDGRGRKGGRGVESREGSWKKERGQNTELNLPLTLYQPTFLPISPPKLAWVIELARIKLRYFIGWSKITKALKDVITKRSWELSI